MLGAPPRAGRPARARAAAALVLLALVLPAWAPAAVASSARVDHAEAASVRAMDRVDALPSRARDAALADAERDLLLSRFRMADDEASSRFLSFRLNATDGNLLNYTPRTTEAVGEASPLFASVRIQPWTLDGLPRVAGAHFRLASAAAAVEAHADATGALRIVRTGDESVVVTFTLAPDFVSRGGGTKHETLITNGTAHAHLVLLGEATLSSASRGTRLTATFRNPGDGVLVLAHPRAEAPAALALDGLVATAAREKLGAIATALDADGSTLGDLIPVSASVEATGIGPGLLRLRLAAPDREGRLVAVGTNARILPASLGPITARLDGGAIRVIDLTARASEDATRAIEGLVSNGTAGAVVNFAPSGTQLLLYVPTFAEHVVTFEQGESGSRPNPSPIGGSLPPPPSETPGLAVPLALLAIGLAARRARSARAR